VSHCPDDLVVPSRGAVVVRAAGLAVGYQGRPVVEGIDVEVRRGTALALVGTNGSGKSTLLKTLVGLLDPVAGSVTVFGDRPGTHPVRVAYLGQFHAASGLLPLRAADVVRMGRYPRRGLVRRLTAADHEAVERALARVAITDLADAPLRSLSGGQQQRVHLAQALAREADLLVMDEPTAGLDAGSRDRYLQVVADELGRGAAVVTATHDIGEALRCDQAVLLARRVVASGPSAAVLTSERLLDAFGVALHAVPHAGHTDLVEAEAAHGHAHPHEH
jgi:ABC-type Mn2+/Zn2+ transport system ATPase subunit